jgi:hypothetical protein
VETPSPTPAVTDCYDKYGITEEDIIDKFGSDEPFPEDAIKIINGENANVTIGKLQVEWLVAFCLSTLSSVPFINTFFLTLFSYRNFPTLVQQCHKLIILHTVSRGGGR